MENEKRNDEVLQFIGYMSQWEVVEKAGISDHTGPENQRAVYPHKKAEIIMMHPKVVMATTKYDRQTLVKMFANKQQLCFRISVATENDVLVRIAKERLEKIV